jgi:hypothetical protein
MYRVELYRWRLTKLKLSSRKFVSLIGAHRRHCCGEAFFMHDGDVVRYPVNGWIMIDVAFSRKVNPNHSRPRITERAGLELNPDPDGFFIFSQSGSDPDDQIRSFSKGVEEMTENDSLICCLTVLGFNFCDKG